MEFIFNMIGDSSLCISLVVFVEHAASFQNDNSFSSFSIAPIITKKFFLSHIVRRRNNNQRFLSL